MAKINLDALIQREDFQVTDQTNSGTKKSTISVVDLEQDSFFFSTIRKPDFQRETNEWDGPKIMEFLESFLDGDLIPAISAAQASPPNPVCVVCRGPPCGACAGP